MTALEVLLYGQKSPWQYINAAFADVSESLFLPLLRVACLTDERKRQALAVLQGISFAGFCERGGFVRSRFVTIQVLSELLNCWGNLILVPFSNRK